jgi:hypothetical protein
VSVLTTQALTIRAATTTIEANTTQLFNPSVKAGTTTLAGLSIVLITITYWILIERDGYLVSTAKIPFAPLKGNLERLLDVTWPDEGQVRQDLPIAEMKRGRWVAIKNCARKISKGKKDGKGDEDEKENGEALVEANWEVNGEGREEENGKGKGKEKDVEKHEEGVKKQCPIRLLYVGRLQDEQHSKSDARTAKGLRQCAAKPEETTEHKMWIIGSAPGSRSVVQMMIWEWVTMWLMLVTLVNTLLYNGFATHERTQDSWPRLVVIIALTVFLVIHVIYTWHSFSSSMTYVVASSTWSMLHRANFVVVDEAQLSAYLENDFRPIMFKELSSSGPGSPYAASLVHAKLPKRRTGLESLHLDAERSKELDEALKYLRSVQDLEYDNVQKAADKALDLAKANSTVMLSVSVATAFSTWTSKALLDNVSTQIGSLSLLASASLGLGAMFSSALQMSTLNSSTHQLLSAKETVINGKPLGYARYRQREEDMRGAGFTKDTLTPHRVTLWHLISALNFWRKLLVVWFGPAYALLPSRKEAERMSENTSFQIKITVREQPVTFTTALTDKHMKDGVNGESIDAINVCFTGYGLNLALY